MRSNQQPFFPDPINTKENKKILKFLKNTTEVQEKLKFIQELDDDIKSVVSDCKSRKRGKIKIYAMTFVKKESTLSFSDMCYFKFGDTGEEDLVDRDSWIISENISQPDKCIG